MEKATNQSLLLKYVVIVLLMFGVGVLPPIAPITAFGMKILGVFLALIFAWTCEIVVWPCFVALIYLATLQGQTMVGVLSVVVGNQTLLLCLAILCFVYAIEKCGLLDWIGKWTLSLKTVKKGPFWFMAIILLVVYIGSGLMLSTAGPMLMVWAVFFKVADMVGIKRYSKYSAIVLVSSAVIGYHGSVIFPFSMWTQIVFGLYQSIMGEALVIPFVPYMIVSLSSGLIMIAVTIAISKFILRPEIDFDLAAFDGSNMREKMTTVQKFGALSIFACIIGLLLPSILPSDLAITKWLNNMNITGIFMISMLVISFFTNEKGESIAPLEKNVKDGLNWQQFFLLATVFYMAGLLTNPETGIPEVINAFVNGVFDGRSIVFVVFFMLVFATVLTNCINNMVCATLMVPFAVTLTPVFGETSITYLMIGLLLMLLQGCALPSGSIIGGILHSTKDRLKSKDVYIYATLFSILLAVITSATVLVAIALA